jgi:hypothetical protein
MVARSVLNPEMVVDVELQFPGLHIYLIQIFLIFSVRIYKNKVYATTVDTRDGLWNQIKHFACEIKTTSGIFKCIITSF